MLYTSGSQSGVHVPQRACHAVLEAKVRLLFPEIHPYRIRDSNPNPPDYKPSVITLILGGAVVNSINPGKKVAIQVAEIVHGVYGADIVTANYVQFCFRRFRSGIFDVKDAPRTGRPIVENIDKITDIIKVDLHVSSRSIVQELKIDHKTVLNHLRKVELKKKLDVWVPHQKTRWIEFSSAKPWTNGMKLTHFLNG
ncbi:histone-lysine N-methyltransferase SETMAR [Trichonephila clavipes]|uniref:Histone-lysine N-methyltransferase SETMAR n=1 Tax=Trichonephila clavipes TaxID=2585209 RepID=A0A8X6RER1_TRICX|nr:histone-lysine N-methyltransferase SETMAR [Trichonephila clavipes]